MTTSKVVAQAAAIAGDRKLVESASADLHGHLATFEARRKADGDEHVGTVGAAETVVAFATAQGIKVPAATAKKSASRAASGGRSGGSAGGDKG